MFKTREQAGRLLGEKILAEISEEKPGLSFVPQNAGLQTAGKPGFNELIVLGIPRGGVVVAAEAAKILSCFLDVIVVKKIGAPSNPELAIGAVGETNGSIYLNKKLIKDLGVGKDYIEKTKKLRNLEIKKREELFRQGRLALDLKDKIVLIVDDGAATGATIIAAIREVWNNNPKKVIVGLPVVAKDTLKKLEQEADEVIFLDAPAVFFAVGQFYQNFPQVSDETVVGILSKESRQGFSLDGIPGVKPG